MKVILGRPSQGTHELLHILQLLFRGHTYREITGRQIFEKEDAFSKQILMWQIALVPYFADKAFQLSIPYVYPSYSAASTHEGDTGEDSISLAVFRFWPLYCISSPGFNYSEYMLLCCIPFLFSEIVILLPKKCIVYFHFASKMADYPDYQNK